MLLKDGLPWWAFAIVGDRQVPQTWHLPHHTAAVAASYSAAQNDDTVDWPRAAAAVAALSEGGYRGEQVKATPGEKRAAARHLARHYRRVKKRVPLSLLALLGP